MQPGQRSRLRSHLSYPKTSSKQLRNVPASFKISDPAKSLNLKPLCCSSNPSLTTAPMTIPSCPSTSPTSICSTTSNITEMGTSEESTKSRANLPEQSMPELLSRMSPVNHQHKPALLDRLSDHVLHHQRVKKTTTQGKLASTLTHYHGMSPKTRALTRRWTSHPRCRKPTLSSRISLATSKKRVLPCSTATGQSRSFPQLNGSAYSAGMPLTSITSSRTSTQCPTASATLSNSGRTSVCSMDLPHQPRLLKPMATGLLPGTAWSMPPSSFSNIENRSSSPTGSTSRDILPLCPPSSTAGSSTTIEPFESEQLSDETLSSQTFRSSQTCRFNGSATRRDLLQANPQSLVARTRKARKADGAPPVEDGMKVDVQMKLPTATTYMSALNAPTWATSPVTAVAKLPTKSERLPPSVRWERRPRFVREFVWSDYDELQNMTTASVTEVIPPIPGPPQNELHNIEKLNVIKTQSHLFRITTPLQIDRLRSLLATHPNRPLVDSVCKGLRVGFWPWVKTSGSDEPSIVDNARLQKIRSPEHLHFMKDQRDEEIRLGRFSDAFSVLSPGMTTIPLWVVPKPHSDKFRLVVDHSAGDYSPNSFISPDDASVHLDTLRVLGQALIKVRK